MKKLSKLLPIIKFIFPALNKRGEHVSGMRAMPLPARSVLPAVTKLLFQLWTFHSSNFFWVAFIYLSHTNPGVLLPNLWFMHSSAGHRRDWLPKALGTPCPAILKGDNLTCIRILAWRPSFLCQMYYRQPRSRVNITGLDFSGRCCPESGPASICPSS